MTNKKYERKAISTKTVLNTWSGVFQNELLLPDNWINISGVLVGIKPSEQPWWWRQNHHEFCDEDGLLSPTLFTDGIHT